MGPKKFSAVALVSVKIFSQLKDWDVNICLLPVSQAQKQRSHPEWWHLAQRVYAKSAFASILWMQKWYKDCEANAGYADFPGVSGASNVWLPKDSQRIWAGSYKGKDWKHLVCCLFQAQQPCNLTLKCYLSCAMQESQKSESKQSLQPHGRPLPRWRESHRICDLKCPAG